ncbi:MAG: glycosyltransferase family 4 protein, partial [Shewanella algae]
MHYNDSVIKQLCFDHYSVGYDFWQVHNVFPAASVAVYELAYDLGVPVVQFLHNYRFGCASAGLYRDGSICRDCSPDGMLSAIRYACWRSSRLATLTMVTALKRFWQNGGYASVAGYIAISQAQKREYVRYGIPESRIQVVPHFLEVDRYGAKPSFLPPKGDVLFLGRITEEKGVGMLLKAWSQVDAGCRKLRIAGDGPKLQAMRVLAQQLHLKYVIFEGFVEKSQHAALWQSCSLFAAPSTWLEPFGMVVLEAWRQGRPVIATNIGSFSELIEDRVDGFLADPNPDDFAEVLQNALDADDEWATMGASGWGKLVNFYDKSTWINNMRRCYEDFNLA